jgi:hypothetical protein
MPGSALNSMGRYPAARRRLSQVRRGDMDASAVPWGRRLCIHYGAGAKPGKEGREKPLSATAGEGLKPDFGLNVRSYGAFAKIATAKPQRSAEQDAMETVSS